MLVLLPFAVEFAILVTALTPLLLHGRFTSRPRLGMALWFCGFSAAFASMVLAIYLASWSVADAYSSHTDVGRPVWLQLIYGLAPWAILTMAGILLSLISPKIEDLLTIKRSVADASALPSEFVFNFEGVPVRKISVELFIAFTTRISGSSAIYLSSSVLALPADQLEAVLWHELGHIRQGHNWVKKIAHAIQTFGPKIMAGRVLVSEVARLCEEAADNFARKRVDTNTLTMARANFE